MLLPDIQEQLQKKLSHNRKIEVLPMMKTLKVCEIWGRPGEAISSINTAIHDRQATMVRAGLAQGNH